MKNSKWIFFITVIVIAVIGFVAVFGAGPVKGAKEIRFGIDIRGGVEAVFTPKDLGRSATTEELESARTIIETRMDAKNILDREVTIDKENSGIIVRFPWKSDETEFSPEKAISELGQMARLTFRDENNQVLVEGKEIKSSKAVLDPNTNKPVVQLEFSAEGARQFSEATEKMVGKQMGIYMDEQLISAPVVNQQITGGQAVIENISSFEEANQLSQQINSGALPFSLNTNHYSTISPTLGSGALDIMLTAGLLAFILIALFMIVRYKITGLVSCIALLLQLAGQILFISIPQVTLTLPGIAGIILSLGMGVDANVIINERISEELRNGATLKGAIVRGYHNAFSSVLDGNLTTAIVAVILMIFGSGTMFSFGYTLLAGIILNFVAGVAATKAMNLSLVQFKPMQNRTLYYVGKDRRAIDFYGKRWVTYLISFAIIAIGVVFCFVNGVQLDTQFKGGAVLKYTFQDEIDANVVSEIAANTLQRPAATQITTDLGSGQKRIVLTLAGNYGITPDQQLMLTNALEERLGSGQISLSETFIVEPYIGKQALEDSIIAIVLSFVMIIAYVWIRFKTISGLSAGVMALVALAHDVLIVFFAFVVLKIPINDAFVAVVLTIIGYSINDTIVIYDRIRENRKKDPKMPVIELVNTSISQSMSRSINTTITTIISSVLMCIFAVLYGIDSIRYFAIPMTVGLICGCYSTICIAGPLWVSWQLHKKKNKQPAV